VTATAPVTIELRPLAAAARGALLWAAGSTFVCDGLQFATMLALVRLLSPSDYGRMALAQTIFSFISVLSFTTFAPHALQSRDPDAVDWQAHFTAASVLNSSAFVLTLLIALFLSRTAKYSGAALPLAVLAIVFIIQVPAILRQTMVQANHDWARTRGLIIAGALLSNVVAIGIATTGGGVWALVVGPALNIMPAALDLLIVSKWRPIWAWRWDRYVDTVKFGVARMASAGVLSGRQAVEQAVLAGTYNFSTLGLFTRSTGLSNLAGGRIGGLASLSLYPIITRAERGSTRFQRLAALFLRGVAWTTIPACVFLAFSAREIATILYGVRWSGVIPLLPFAAAQAALGGISWAAYTLLLGNDEIRACVVVDFASAGIGATLVFWLVPLGPQVYLAGLAGMYVIILFLLVFLLRRSGAITVRDVRNALLPPIISCVGAAGAYVGAHAFMLSHVRLLPLTLISEGAVFFLFVVLMMRIGFPRLLSELLEVVPGGRHAVRALAFN
jgi:O-antigen/teichoic acid export membrane protein